MTTPMHDDPRIYPTLPAASTPPSDILWRSCVETATEFRTCWEYVLTHDLTEREGAAFWTGVNLMHQAQTTSAVSVDMDTLRRTIRMAALVVLNEIGQGDRALATAIGAKAAVDVQALLARALTPPP